MQIKMSLWNDKEAKILFLKYYFNVLIKKLKIKHLKNIDLLHELLFYNKFNIEKISKAFNRYAKSYKVEIIDSRYSLVQLEASRLSIKDLFKGLLDEIKGFKYQITVKVFLSKHKENGDKGSALVYFNSITKTIINSKYDLDKSFQEVLYRIDKWINEGSVRVIKSVEAEYVNISIYSPLLGN